MALFYLIFKQRNSRAATDYVAWCQIDSGVN